MELPFTSMTMLPCCLWYTVSIPFKATVFSSERMPRSVSFCIQRTMPGFLASSCSDVMALNRFHIPRPKSVLSGMLSLV